MTSTALQLAQILQAELLGSAETTIDDAQTLEFAGVSHISFIAEEKYLQELPNCDAGSILIQPELKESIPPAELDRRTFMLVNDPLQSFVEAIQFFRPQREFKQFGISPKAIVSESASIGAGTNIHPGAVIGDEVLIGENCNILAGAVIGDGVTIGNNVTIHPNVVLYHDITIQDRVCIHANAVIGADGFGYRMIDGKHTRIPQLGTVIIENDVEIGACSTIDRAMAGETIIGEGTKLDNQIQIAHNCRIGKHNAYASQVGFAGSCTTGDYVICGGQVGLADHVKIGDQVQIGAQSGVHRDLPSGNAYLGTPAEPAENATKAFMIIRKLPELRQQVRNLMKEVKKLTQQVDASEGKESSKNKAA